MSIRDYDDPTIFIECVSAITLKAEPLGFLKDCLGENGLDITVVLARMPGRRHPMPWLDVTDLEELSWSNNIRVAHIASDHLEGSRGLSHIARIEDLTITIAGKHFDDRDVQAFHNAILNLRMLRRLRLIVQPDAQEQSKEDFKWPFSPFTVEIITDGPPRR